MNQPENPHAFACAAENGHQPGMTLRDYFAAQALIRAAGQYLGHATQRGHRWFMGGEPAEDYQCEPPPDDFYWPSGWRWNPKSPKEDLVRAAALIAAHLDALIAMEKGAAHE